MGVASRTPAGACCAVVAVALSAGAGAGQTLQAGDLTLDFTGRVQVQLNTTSVDGGDVVDAPASTAFEIRRARFGVRFTHGEWVTGEVEAELSGGDARLTDGYIDLALASPLSVRAGQFKKPFGGFELESSTKIRTIERGLRVRGVDDLTGVPGEGQWLLGRSGYLGRQVGVAAHGQLAGLGYEVGVFNGEGANVRETAGSKAYAARATYRVWPSLVLGGGVSAQPTGRFDGSAEEYGVAFELDAMWGEFRQEGLHVLAELMAGDNPLRAVGVELPTMVGVQALAAWFWPRAGRIEGIEPVLRASWADPDTGTDNDHGLLVTPGVNVYFDGRNRLMANGDVYVPAQEGLDPEYALVVQLQVYF